MFNFIIATNKATPEIDKTLEILLKTKTVNDKIIIVNYNNYSIKYRSVRDIEYHHIKKSKKQALMLVLPKNGNVVILDGNITISGTFVEDLYKHYDFEHLCALRVDKISNNGKFIESDYRVGSNITKESFKHFAIAFNTALLNRVGETPKEMAAIASEWNIPLKLLPNVITYVTSIKLTTRKRIGMTILVPSLKYKYINDLKNIITSNDKLFEFNGNRGGFTSFINQRIVESNNDCIIIINPESRLPVVEIIKKIKDLYDGSKCLLFDTKMSLSTDAWLVLPKNRFHYSHRVFEDTRDLHHYIASYNNKNVDRYIEELKNDGNVITDPYPDVINSNVESYPKMISIIIPFMYNGDRWTLFESSIENLYGYTKPYDNIEIIIHETSPERYITQEFIEKYNLVYMFSEYHGLFHRAWALNVPSKHIAKGDVFVFYDGDLLIDDKWVRELLTCDKSKSYIGWGTMKNLNKKGTDYYLSKKKIINSIERLRNPGGNTAAGGINVIPRDDFFSMGGWPESYKDKGYGGEDNSMANKMMALGMYNANTRKWRMFKSTVYHMFHGHTTHRDPSRSLIFKKHKEYKKEEWLDHIERNHDWGTVNNGIVNNPVVEESLLYVYKNTQKPRITVCITNFMRYNSLINSLNKLLNTGVSLNVILWINGSDNLKEPDKTKIEKILNKFSGNEIIYSKKNMGTGYPRYMMLNKARHEYNTEFIMTMDDDIMFENPESVVVGATILRQDRYHDYGAVGLWCHPIHRMVKITDGSIVKIDTVEGFHDVDCIGAAAMTIRREVLNTCNCDPQYIIGLVDWDFSLNMKQQGWKLGLLCDNRYKPINDQSDNNQKYNINRRDKSVIEQSKTIFEKKWNIKVI